MRSVWWWIVFAIVVVAIMVAVDRTMFHIRDSLGFMCDPSNASKFETGQAIVEFNAVEPCLPTRVELVAGTTYRFDIEVSSDWMDGTLSASPNGLVDATPPVMHIFTPFRRHLSRPWFELTRRVGRSGGETVAIGSGTCYTTRSGGPLYLYVNEAVSGLMFGRWWASSYSWSMGKNGGTATVTITAVEQPSRCDQADRCGSCGSQ